MTEQQKDFVQMYLKHRDKIIAHNLAYGNNSNYDSVESSANRLMRNPEIAEAIRSVEDILRHEVEEEFKAKYREELLTIYDKRRILKKIATGEMYIEQKYKGKNCTQCSQYISPTYHMMMQALKEDSKLAGHYPHKQNGKWIIPALQTEQEQEEIISTLKKDLSEPCNGADNKRQQVDEAINDNQPLTVEQENTTETPLPPLQGTKQLGGDIGVRPEDVPNAFGRQSGWLTPGEQDTADENTPPENDNKRQQIDFTPDQEISLPFRGIWGKLPQNETNPENDNKRPLRTDVHPGGQHPNETTIDNQPLTDELKTQETHLSRHSFSEGGTINSSGKMIFPCTFKEPYMINT